jgi:hypothetical protein
MVCMRLRAPTRFFVQKSAPPRFFPPPQPRGAKSELKRRLFFYEGATKVSQLRLPVRLDWILRACWRSIWRFLRCIWLLPGDWDGSFAGSSAKISHMVAKGWVVLGGFAAFAACPPESRMRRGLFWGGNAPLKFHCGTWSGNEGRWIAGC